MSLQTKSREELEEIADSMGIKITFDNPPEKCGLRFINEDGTEDSFIHADDIWDEIFAPIFETKDDVK